MWLMAVNILCAGRHTVISFFTEIYTVKANVNNPQIKTQRKNL